MGRTITAFDYNGQSDEDSQAFLFYVQNAFKEDGLSPISDPGGTLSWSGMHAAGIKKTWYTGVYKGSEPFFVRFAEIPLPNGTLHFMADISWNFKGTESAHKKQEVLLSEYSRHITHVVNQYKTEQGHALNAATRRE